MISYAYVNGTSEELIPTSPMVSLQEFMLESEISIHESIVDFMDKLTGYVEESAITGEANEEQRLLLEAEGDNIFAKIGEKVISLWNKVIEFIQKCIDKITGLSFKSKKDIDKLEMLCKEYPNLKDEIICSFQKGELDVTSARTLKELETTYNEICKMSKNADVTPGSMEEKWKKAVEKAEKADKSPLITLGKAAGAGITAILAIRGFRGELLKVKNNCQEQRKKASQLKEENVRLLDEMKNKKKQKGVEYINQDMGKMEVMYRMNAYMAGEYSAAAGTSAKVLDKIANAVVRTNSKYTSKKVKETFHKDIRTEHNRIKEKDAEKTRKK